MRKTHVDIETYSECDLKKSGLYRYAEHPSTAINVLCWADGDGPVNVWLPFAASNLGNRILLPLYEYVHNQPEGTGCTFFDTNNPHFNGAIKKGFVAHNAQFERVVMNKTAGAKLFIIKTPIEGTVCTMAKAAVHGLPHALEGAAKALGSYPKRVTGANEMRYFAKPRADGTRPMPWEDPDRFLTMVKYCIDDVRAERDLDNNIPDLTPAEVPVYFLDQRINERGVTADLDAVNDALVVVAQYKFKLAELCKRITGFSPSQTAKLAEWVRANGYPQLPSLQAPIVKKAVADPKCPENIREVLKAYSTYGMKAVSKLDAILRAVCADSKLYGMFYYYGAGPGRWSSRIVQLHNLMRPVIKDADNAIEAMKLRSLNMLRWLYEGTDAMKVIASCIRGMLVAGKGSDLVAYDFSQIESRIQAWLAGAEWKLKIFREDKIKIYNATGAMMFGKEPEEIVDDGENQLYTASKIGELACGYGGGSAAVEKFAEDMGIELSIGSETIKLMWRQANVEQVDLWYKLEDAARAAVANPGSAFAIPNKKIMFKVVGRWLYMRLPSGRMLAYLDPMLLDGSVTYMGVDTHTRQWTRVHTYGGRLLQNACEGIGRDLLVNGLLHMEDAGYSTIMTVHDEGVFEVPEGYGSDEEAVALMTTPVAWAEGLPVKCVGWRAKRYRK